VEIWRRVDSFTIVLASAGAPERARIAAELLSSLEESDEDVKAAWAAEIERRASDADSDPDDEQDWRIALAEVRREVLSR
jgi:hypothetical protein